MTSRTWGHDVRTWTVADMVFIPCPGFRVEILGLPTGVEGRRVVQDRLDGVGVYDAPFEHR